jgi:hypothetical protein
MKHNCRLNICKTCRHRIEKYGELAFELLCQVFIVQENDLTCFFDTADEEAKKYLSPVVRFLEKKGVLISRECHESQSLVQLLLVDKRRQEGQHEYLCWCK